MSVLQTNTHKALSVEIIQPDRQTNTETQREGGTQRVDANESGYTEQKKEQLYLYSVFRQVYFESEQFPGIQIRVVRVLEGLFQLLQLIAREDRPGQADKSFTESSDKGR